MDNGEPGLYIGDSPHADAVVAGNVALHNGVGSGEGIGILLRDASEGVLHHDQVEGNCVGIVLLETGASDPAGDWTIQDNHVAANNGVCPPNTEEGEAGPSFSGLGILVWGGHDAEVQHNQVVDNRPAARVAVGRRHRRRVLRRDGRRGPGRRGRAAQRAAGQPARPALGRHGRGQRHRAQRLRHLGAARALRLSRPG
jgi:hypothetical protein